MAESELVESPKPGAKPRRVGYLKMKVIDDLRRETIDEVVRELASGATHVDTDGSVSYVDLKSYIPRHDSQVIPPERVGEVLPWVHIAIGNAKRLPLDTHRDIKPESLQKHLDGFCYKFNRRYASESLFARLLFACVNYKNELRYVYG